MKDTAFQIHTTEENKRWLEDRAADLDCSLSEYVHELMQKHIDIVSDEKEYPYDDSERLQTIVDDVYDETDILLREFSTCSCFGGWSRVNTRTRNASLRWGWLRTTLARI